MVKQSIEKPMLLDTIPVSVREEILNMRLPPNNKTYIDIVKWLKDEKGIKVSDVSLAKWLNRRSSAATNLIYGSKEFKEDTNRIYGKILFGYFESLRKIMELEEEICRSKQLDILVKTKCAVDTFNVIREGTVCAKDLIVGNVGADKAQFNLDDELDRIEHDVLPRLSIVPKR